MSEQTQFLVMNLDEQRVALDLDAVERVVRMVEITPLPTAENKVLGMINVQGVIVPVFSLKKYFGFPAGDVGVSDQLVIARTSRRPVALAVNGTEGVVICREGARVRADEILPHLEGVAGVIKGGDGMIIISDLERLLCLEEDERLDRAMAAVAAQAEQR